MADAFIHPDVTECIFCSSAKLTNEHYWGKWLDRQFPSPFPGNSHTVAINRIDLDGASHNVSTDRGFLTSKNRPTRSFLKVVCEQCNNGWMSDMQNEAKSIISMLITGQINKINASQQLAVSNWAVMFSMVFDFADLSTQVVSIADRKHLYLNRTPPEHWRVFFGYHETLKWQGKAWHASFGQADEGDTVTRHQTQITTFGVANIWFQTACSVRNHARTFIEGFSYDPSLGIRQVWPILFKRVARPLVWQDDASLNAISSTIRQKLIEDIRRLGS